MLLYFEAEQYLVGDPKNASLRSRIFDAAQSRQLKSNPKQIFALVSCTQKYKRFIDEIVKNSRLMKVPRTKLPKKLSSNLVCLLVHDLLFSKTGRIQSAKHPIKDFILGNKTRLNSELVKLKLRLKVKNVAELVEDDSGDDYTPVRWFRVNTIKASVASVMTKDPFFARMAKVDTLADIQGDTKSLGKIYHDVYIPNLFGINPKEKITNSAAYKQGHIVIQDRSSCFPAHILNPAPGDKIIDSCAAPGNKTTHAAAYVKNSRHAVVAFERNPNRAKVLQTMVERAGASKCVSVKHLDFTQANPRDYPDVVGFIVDPSCSGSGIFGREKDDKSLVDRETGGDLKEIAAHGISTDKLNEKGSSKDVNLDINISKDFKSNINISKDVNLDIEKNQQNVNISKNVNSNIHKNQQNINISKNVNSNIQKNQQNTNEAALVAKILKLKNQHDPQRLAKLSSFQFTIVKHALCFPSAKKLVYSTCSIHAEENEQVVIDLLNDPKIQELGWRLCPRESVIPTWPRRGWKDEFLKARFSEEEAIKCAQGCIRSLPKIDGGIGFFAAAFERDLPGQ